MKSKAHVAVLGSANMDIVVYADRAPAMGETVAGRRFCTVVGGKGVNQAIAAALAGADVHMLGAVGTDDFGRRVLASLTKADVDTTGVVAVDEPTGTAHIVVDSEGGNSIVVVPGANGTVLGLSRSQEILLEGCDALLLQLEIPDAAVVEGAKAARRHGVRVFLTPAPARPLPDNLFEAVDVLVPNQHEAATLTGHNDPERALKALLELVPAVVVTLGSEGCIYGERGSPPAHLAARNVVAVDTTAAGDTFVGVLAVALSERQSFIQAVDRATTAAGLCVQRSGASSSIPTRDEVDAVIAGPLGPSICRTTTNPKR